MGYKNKLEKWFPLQGELAQSLKKFYIHTFVFKKQNRKEKEEETEQQQTHQFNHIVHILRVHHLTLNFIVHNKYISTLYLYTYIHTLLRIVIINYTRKMVPITGRARSFLLVFKNKIERRWGGGGGGETE